ncbi:DUF3025 domain-containing protein [Tahibacter soli]|uniref:DUF3025 domain-containing protein n=1 Tax=Tahibacter soli TaxID=2983605 RepID=A0A9X3YH04_9GAMM|nr:DUF3025 domain-containing protein [Tahibacter soli]MDC8012159.1 DUF3025 domain-containing protein [Tahibacter soli]
MRFVAPARAAIPRSVYAQAPLAAWHEYERWLARDDFPPVDELNDGWADAGGRRFVEQTPELLADGLHYETRIAQHGRIATRAGNWHDFFNALVWRRYPAIKASLNARQVAEIGVMGDKTRSRAQCALTHFDEGGVIVVVRDPALVGLWDAHDWHGLFWRERAAWNDGRIEAQVFGHALLEMALVPDTVITGKALAIADTVSAIPAVAAAVEAGLALNDPQELRPLPISGIPGWHRDNAREAFYRDAPCFKPLRPGRTYPAVLSRS